MRDLWNTKGVPAFVFIDNGRVRGDRGLLPYPDPIARFPDSSEFRVYDEFAEALPHLLYGDFLFSAAKVAFQKLPSLPVEKLVGHELKRACRQINFFVSAYAWLGCSKFGIHSKHDTFIPANLALPAWKANRKLGVKYPVLNYDSYAMNNFRLASGSRLHFKNLELLQHFLPPHLAEYEAGFILPHVEIEAEAGLGMVAIPMAQVAVNCRDAMVSAYYISCMRNALDKVADTMRMIPSVCDPDKYFQFVRPWIFGFREILFEDVAWFREVRGESGAMSPSIRSFEIALGIQYDEKISAILDEFNDQRTGEQREWLFAVAQGPSIKEFVRENHGNAHLRDAFNAANEGLLKVQEAHREMTLLYIKTKGQGDTATGLTHYENFLDAIIRATKENIIL